MPLLELRDLRITFPTLAGLVRAVNGIDLDLERGEIFGLVGETGCGKTVTGLALLGLVPPPGKMTAARLTLGGRDLLTIADWNQIRGRSAAMIFQDPAASLNPTFTIGDQLTRVIRQHARIDGAGARRRAIDLLADVGLPDTERTLRAYPHELSGGMQQRAMISLALASGAELLIADEPTTALDVTIQAQILRLLVALRERHGLTILLITHDLGVVAQTCDRVAVLYAGTTVETAPTAELFRAPRHPYTQGLLSALPRPGSHGKPLAAIDGSVPSGFQIIPGCPFAPRCPFVFEKCENARPLLKEVAARHAAACHLFDGEV
ncbi:MAG: ABC transporter ATP-binding protein [Chloroflexi bacterium]|nr:ABC transporter ATP-binding protein [Chloroflexota bacterium]